MASTPAWLPRQPVLLSRWLVLHERLHRFGRLKVIVVAIVALAGAAALVLVVTSRIDVTPWLTALQDYWPLLFAVATLHSASTVARQLRRSRAEWSDSWLAAAPVSLASVRMNRAIDCFASLFLQYVAACSLLLAIAIVGENPHALLQPVAAMTGGIVAGSLRALWPARQQRERFEASRYAPSIVSGNTAPLRPSNRALSHWPVARALSMGRPENARLLFLFVAVFAVQAGTPAVRGIAIMLVWTVAAYLVSLLSAGAFVASEAARWLRPTPVSFFGLAWPLIRRALLHQAVGTAIVAAGAIATRSSWIPVLGVSVASSALLVVVYALALWMSRRA